MSRPKIDGLALVAVLFVVFFLLNLFRDRFDLATAAAAGKTGEGAEDLQISTSITIADKSSAAPDASLVSPVLAESQFDQAVLQMPYAEYAVTQGVHGFEYGHMAIDITAGKDAPIHSPINGLITARLTDPVGSTILVIENEHWIITLVHGLFSVTPGEFVQLGQVVGRESNQGNTVDMEGRSCRGRDCGFHTHINIFDKQTGQNVDPLVMFPVDD